MSLLVDSDVEMVLHTAHAILPAPHFVVDNIMAIDTALHAAGSAATARLLLKHEASMTQRNKAGVLFAI